MEDWLVVGKVQFNAAAVAGNGQKSRMSQNSEKFRLAHVMHGLGVSFSEPNFET